VVDADRRPAVVLLVDDDARILRAVGAGLALEGFEVVPARRSRPSSRSIPP
jgi:DNA-binding response OmpR family regulator